MTIISEQRRCRWCGAGFAWRSGPGRPPEYCRRSHRQRAYEARRLAQRHGLEPDQVLVSRQRWQELRDRIYLLEAALEDVAHDVADAHTSEELLAALRHLQAAARELVEAELEPLAVG